MNNTWKIVKATWKVNWNFPSTELYNEGWGQKFKINRNQFLHSGFTCTNEFHEIFWRALVLKKDTWMGICLMHIYTRYELCLKNSKSDVFGGAHLWCPWTYCLRAKGPSLSFLYIVRYWAASDNWTLNYTDHYPIWGWCFLWSLLTLTVNINI